jgi:septal ring factor EnvC (AmiA/AmiB activator)
MSEDDTQSTAESEARGAELRENIALTDARRAEEEVAKAHAEKEAAEKKEEKLSRKERRLREKAERVHAEADRQRAEADATTEATQTAEAASRMSGARVASPGLGSTFEPDAAASAAGGQASPPFPGADKLPPAAQRTEVLVGAAFAGSFILARILKRIFD